ncbi:flavin reductase family protein [Haloglomus litoreum]|uniref:flavin reductase family protein n=1 Tax=Haloglomus litoreum TaxID=3034026 RepID=UPI0023E8C4C5|nr:flavin reductase family protein [Haloglomus sp. DT116]
MEFARDEIDYRTLSAAVVPRPIAWVSSVSADGEENLAPFSYFNAVSVTPPVVMVSVTRFDDSKPDRFKDTLANVQETGEFVVNVVTRPLFEQMVETSARVAGDVDEWELADVEQAPSRFVDPPRVAATDIALECRCCEQVMVGDNTVVFGDVVHAHVADEVTTGGKVDVSKLDAVGRLSGGLYTFVEEAVSPEGQP